MSLQDIQKAATPEDLISLCRAAKYPGYKRDIQDLKYLKKLIFEPGSTAFKIRNRLMVGAIDVEIETDEKDE